MRRRYALKPTLPTRLLGILAVVSCLGWSGAVAADGAWKFQVDERGHPELSYLDNNNRTVFMVGCGHAFAVHAVYPGAPKKDGEKATITIASAKTQMDFAGEIDSGFTDGPPNTTHFVQWDLGYRRQDPNLYEKKWHQLESRFFDLLDSKQPLTISAEGQNYVLPAVSAARWRQRFHKIC
ncbi:MAG: hypothetical protein ABSB77_16620 [Xanthobacteraceae bacterium]|jgi:hypothetical protein